MFKSGAHQYIGAEIQLKSKVKQCGGSRKWQHRNQYETLYTRVHSI